MSTFTFTETSTLASEECYLCGIIFAMPKRFNDQMRENGETFYCPSGHPQGYCKPKLKVLEEKLSEAQRSLSAAKCETAQERSKREEAERKLTRHERRTKNGVCPCCQRSFMALARHMKTKHPEYKP